MLNLLMFGELMGRSLLHTELCNGVWASAGNEFVSHMICTKRIVVVQINAFRRSGFRNAFDYKFLSHFDAPHTHSDAVRLQYFMEYKQKCARPAFWLRHAVYTVLRIQAAI